MLKIVVIGGGTGSYVTLTGLREYAGRLDLSAIVTVADSGGSAKRERDEFGLLPISDVRKALLALSSGDTRGQRILRDLFTYRFAKGGIGLEGGTFGNLFLVALTEILGSETRAIREAEKILQTKGRVIPVSLQTSNIVVEYENGQVIVGEHYLDEMLELPVDGTQRIKRSYLLPPVEANPEALDALTKADWIIFPPGDFFASVVVNLNVDGITQAIKDSEARLLQVVNLMTKYGQTYGWKASDHVQRLEEYLGKKLDRVVIHEGNLPRDALKKYQQERDFPVEDDLEDDPRVFRKNLLSMEGRKVAKGDTIKRSYLRHDPEKLARVLIDLVTGSGDL